MATTLPVPADTENFGPKMQALTDLQRRFVLAHVLGAGTQSGEQCAVAAGYSVASARFTAAHLMRNIRVQEAIHEEALSRLQSASLIGINVLIDIAQNYSHKDQLKAARILLEANRVIRRQDQVIEIKHTVSDQEQIVAITALANRLGLDPARLIGQGAVTDAEFEVIEPEDMWTVGGEHGT